MSGWYIRPYDPGYWARKDMERNQMLADGIEWQVTKRRRSGEFIPRLPHFPSITHEPPPTQAEDIGKSTKVDRTWSVTVTDTERSTSGRKRNSARCSDGSMYVDMRQAARRKNHSTKVSTMVKRSRSTKKNPRRKRAKRAYSKKRKSYRRARKAYKVMSDTEETHRLKQHGSWVLKSNNGGNSVAVVLAPCTAGGLNAPFVGTGGATGGTGSNLSNASIWGLPLFEHLQNAVYAAGTWPAPQKKVMFRRNKLQLCFSNDSARDTYCRLYHCIVRKTIDKTWSTQMQPAAQEFLDLNHFFASCMRASLTNTEVESTTFTAPNNNQFYFDYEETIFRNHQFLRWVKVKKVLNFKICPGERKVYQPKIKTFTTTTDKILNEWQTSLAIKGQHIFIYQFVGPEGTEYSGSGDLKLMTGKTGHIGVEVVVSYSREHEMVVSPISSIKKDVLVQSYNFADTTALDAPRDAGWVDDHLMEQKTV